MLRAIDPSTGTLVREVPPQTPAAVEARLDAAVRAFGPWSELAFEARGEHLRAVARTLRERKQALAALMTEEMGKVVREAQGEIEKCAWTCEHFAAAAEGYLAAEVLPSDATESRVQHQPLGPVLGILPWNSPFWLAFRVCAPALMAGNTVLIKHDLHVPGCALVLEELFGAAGLPAGVVSALLVETSRVAGLIRDPRVAAVSFTGSTRGGRAVAEVAGAALKPSVLELGGSDPAIVLADADLDQAAEDVGLMRVIAAGQSCIAAKRVIVERAVYEPFLERFERRLSRVVVGDPRDPASDMGPLARADLREELHRQVTASLSEGARLVLGGEIPEGPGCFYPVTLLADCDNGMTACREETFGPVAPVIPVASADEAVAVANDTPYGLGGSVWSSRARGEAIAARLRTGQVAVNGLVKSDPRLPSGGTRRSGWGKELGPHGIRAFTNAQQVWVGPRRV